MNFMKLIFKTKQYQPHELHTIWDRKIRNDGSDIPMVHMVYCGKILWKRHASVWFEFEH